MEIETEKNQVSEYWDILRDGYFDTFCLIFER